MNLIPNREPVGQAHILCEQDKYTILNTGEVVTKDQFGEPFEGHALAHALRFHGFPGVVVRTRGNQYRGLSINNPNGNVVHSVQWTTGDVHDITVIGDEPNLGARLGGVACFDKAGDVRFEKLTMMNDGASACPFIVNATGLVGRILLYDIQFLPMDPSAWMGKGMKWNLRGHGVAKKWDCRNLQLHKAVEHGLYIDNHLEDSYFVRCSGGEMGRTMIQIVNRQESGPGSRGILVIAHCVSRGVGGQGGSDYTIVGNGEGTIYFLNNKSFASTQGAFVHWTDKGHGAYLTSNGYSSRQLVIHDFEVASPSADRDHMMIAGVEEVIISDWKITGNRTAIGLDSKYGGDILNGSVELDSKGLPSQDSGWNSSKKMTKGVWQNGVWKSTHTLSNAEIDAMALDRG